MVSETEARQRLVSYFQQFKTFSTVQVSQIAGHFRWRTLDAGTFLVQQGETTSQIGYVAEGISWLYYIDRDGTERTKSFCTENHLVGAYSAMLLSEPSRFYIRAEVSSALLMITFDMLHTFSETNAIWQSLHLKLVQELFIRKERRESELLLDDAAERYRKFQEQYPGLENRVKQYQIASYLGITPVALSRIRARLKPVNLG